MSTTVCLGDYVTLGQQLYILINSDVVHVDVVNKTVPAFLQSIDHCGLSQTSVAAEPLRNITSYPYSTRSSRLMPVAGGQMRAYMGSISEALYSEVAQHQLVAVDTGATSQELRELPTKVTLDDTEQRLLNETVTCLECGAYRAGAVMGWNLAYDFIRRWVWDNRSNDFNNTLTTQWLRRGGSPMYQPIQQYDDFLSARAPGERIVIDTCYHAQIIGERLRDELRHFLRRRNDYAHPSFRIPSAEQTNAYLHDLIEIITHDPFS